MMRIAAIDIGTNTILMLIADYSIDGTLTVIKDEHHIARLGKGVDELGMIQQETFFRVRNILAQLLEIAHSNHAQHIIACGTSALRDAANRSEFLDFIKKELALEIRILSGHEEADRTYLGAVSEHIKHFPSGEFAVLDIGGGSTELVIGHGTDVSSATSIDIGSVRITERILKTSPPGIPSLTQAEQIIQAHLESIPPLRDNITLIGVAGTLTTLAALDLRLQLFDKALINHHTLTREHIENIFQELRYLTLDELKAYPQIHPSRADILLAGILILLEVLKKVKLQHITVSDRGLRYGILLKTVLANPKA